MSGYAGIDTALLMRHDRPGPRYTSYPTAPVWTEAFGEKEWAQAMARANEKSDEPFSLYVHIPYCRSMCLYCGCSVIITRNLDKARSYVDLVIEEARRLARELPDRRRIQQHHWGGGTPTYLPPDELAKLYRGIAELFPPDPEAEIGIEVDPSVTTLTQLGVLRELGFNRISMGIQDFTPEVQEAVHRIQGVEATEDLIREARRLGFESVNVDLICGLPHQEPESFGRTIDQVIEWRIDRVACYSFAYVPWLKKHQKALPEASLPDRERKFQLFTTALAKFGSAGYVAIGLDHFARPEDSLAVAAGAGRLHRNFMGYTTRMGQGRQAEDMLPLGVTSIGEVQGSFGHNLKERRDWQRRVEEG
ncbi:MAG: oxygen-independent coproporphyrinogen III oxidase, partial [Planctomycetota bacterium]